MFQHNKYPYKDSFFDLREVFGEVDVLTKTPKEIDECFLKRKRSGNQDPKLHFAWKVLRDPYYRYLAETMSSFEELYDAGFFVDEINPEDTKLLQFQMHEARTPINQIAKNLKKLTSITKPVVLLCTGAFSPLHNGHIGMMYKAKETLEEQGYQVIGGYFSPSHDAYVSTKYNSSASLLAAHRVYLAQLINSESDWLLVDPWESRYLPTDINFTDVIFRLETYLKTYLPTPVPIEIAYVYGGDNAGFSGTFSQKGIGVCVGRRNSSPDIFNAIKKKHPQATIFWTAADDLVSEITSTKVRKWKPGLLPSNAEKIYFTWKKTSSTCMKQHVDQSASMFYVTIATGHSNYGNIR